MDWRAAWLLLLAVLIVAESVAPRVTRDVVTRGLACTAFFGSKQQSGAVVEGYRWGRESGSLLERLYDTSARSYISPVASRVRRLLDSPVVIIGETHSNPLHHDIEYRVVKALADQHGDSEGRNNVAIGFECFHRQHQRALDRFVFGESSLGRLAKETRWSSTSDYALSNWAKTLNFAKKRGIRCVGLNCPSEVPRLVAEMGLAGLPPALREQLGEVDLGDAQHRAAFDGRLEASGHASGLAAEARDRYYEIDCLWEDYMASSAAAHLLSARHKGNGEPVLVVLAGSAHVDRRGLPLKIQRRIGGASPYTILPLDVDWTSEELPDVQNPPKPATADLIWYTQRDRGDPLATSLALR